MGVFGNTFSLLGSMGDLRLNGNPYYLMTFAVSDTQIDLSWTNNSKNETGFTIERSTDGSSYSVIQITLAGVNSYSDAGLTTDTLYYYRVRGYRGNQYSSYSNVSSSTTILNPSSLANGLLWYDSENITNVSGKASNLTELFNGVNHAVQTTDSMRPTIVADDLNGKDALLFDGLTQRMSTTNTITQSQPFTVYMVVKHLANKNNAAFSGSPTSVLALPYTNASGQYLLYAGAFTTYANNSLNTPLAFCLEVNGATSKIRSNAQDVGNTNAGSNSIADKIYIGSQVNSDASCTNIKLFEYILYSGVHDTNTKDKIWKYLQNKYNSSFGRPELIENRFDGLMDNSVIYSTAGGYNQTNSFAEYSFNTSSDKIFVKANPTSGGGYIHIFEDDIYKSSTVFNTWTTKEITLLTSGNKKVTILNDSNTAPSGTVIGTYINELKVLNYEKIDKITESQKIIILGDSISVGGVSTVFVNEGFGRLFKVENGIPAAHLGWSYAKLVNFATDQNTIDTIVGYITSLFSNVSGRKIFIMQPGINDIMLDSTSSAVFKVMYENLIDAIHTSDNDIEFYCLSLIYRSGEGAPESSYRTAVSDICSIRNWATYVNGLPICTYPGDYNDTVHPNTSGHKKIKDVLYSVIYP